MEAFKDSLPIVCNGFNYRVMMTSSYDFFMNYSIFEYLTFLFEISTERNKVFSNFGYVI